MALSLNDIRGLFELHGKLVYRSAPVTQLEHTRKTARCPHVGCVSMCIAAELLHDTAWSRAL